MECLSEGSRSTHFPKYAKGFMKHLPWRPIPLSLAVSKGAVGKEAGREPRGLNGGRLDTHLRTCSASLPRARRLGRCLPCCIQHLQDGGINFFLERSRHGSWSFSVCRGYTRKRGGHVLQEQRKVLRDPFEGIVFGKEASAAEFLTAPLPHARAVTLLWPQRRRWR